MPDGPSNFLDTGWRSGKIFSKVSVLEAGLERKYLKWFIAVLVAGIVAGVVLNSYYDLKARNEITVLLKELFASANAGDAQRFIRAAHITDIHISGDLPPNEVFVRERGLLELYTEIVSGGLTLQSVSFVKTIERLASVVSLKVTSRTGEEKELHLVLIRESDRQKRTRWLPYALPNPEDECRELVKKASGLLDAKAIREEVKANVLNAVASVEPVRNGAFDYVESLLKTRDEIMGDIRVKAPSLANKISDESIRKEFEKRLKDPENPASALELLVSPHSKFQHLVGILRAISNAKPEEAKATSDKEYSAASSLYGRANRLLEPLKFLTTRPVKEQQDERIKKIENLISKFVPDQRRDELTEKLKAAADVSTLKAVFLQVRECAASPEKIAAEKTQAVIEVVGKTGIPEKTKLEFSGKLRSMGSAADFERIAEELASLATTEETMRSSFLLAISESNGIADNAIALEDARKYFQAIVAAAGYDTSTTTSSILGHLEFDSLQPANIYAKMVSDLRYSAQVVKNYASAPAANMRRKTGLFVNCLPDIWGAMKSEDEFLKWAFPESVPENPALVGEAREFFGRMNGKQVEVANVHQWYDRYCTCALVIVRVLLDSDKYGKAVEEKYEGAKARYEDAKKGCEEARKKCKEVEKMHEKGEKEYEEAKGKYEEMQREHKDAKEKYEEAERIYREAQSKREYAVLPLILIQKMTPDWSLVWTLVRASSVHYEDYKKAVDRIYDEEMKRREEILPPQ